MKLIYTLLGALSLVVFSHMNASAATYRVDDTATLPGESQVKMHWRSTGVNNSNGNIVDLSLIHI